MKTYLFIVSCMIMINAFAQAEWKPAQSPLMTRWAEDVKPDAVHPEYPRPQMVRDQWKSLNGLWEYSPAKPDGEPPIGKALSGTILVPFPVESALSGVGEHHERLWYRRTFDPPKMEKDSRLLLHFGAVDWDTTIWVNGKKVGNHKGGYDSFTFDITAFLNTEGEQELIVHVFDPTDKGTQPRGKQVLKPHGILYTPTTGIWQTVWLEVVPAISIDRLAITPDFDNKAVSVNPALRFPVPTCCEKTAKKMSEGYTVAIDVLDGPKPVASAKGKPYENIALKIPDAKSWTPDTPHLYNMRVELLKGDKKLDTVKSYFAIRKTSLGKDDKGITRMMLNNEFVFQFGPLDQGFWPDGLYTAPTDEALRYDIEVTKQLGFNMIRKHVKVEPDRWYYWCDKLGMLVWQDMPNAAVHDQESLPEGDTVKQKADAQFQAELTAMVRNLYSHPCIVVWVPFNEGWGQYHTKEITDLVHSLDATRLVDSASGWHDRGTGDILDIHDYPGPKSPEAEARRAIVLGEFGGLGLPLEGHTWTNKDNWGYRGYKTKTELEKAYMDLMRKLKPLIEKPGLSAAVYTQTTDVETEVNGFMTYDRKVLKLEKDKVQPVHKEMITQSKGKEKPPA